MEVRGQITEEAGQLWYTIEHADRMDPFLMTMASDGNHWLFLSSNGGMTAGRVNPDKALFPYYTQDKLEEMSGNSGGLTLIRIKGSDGKVEIWRPFTRNSELNPAITRNIRKNILGNHIVMEEHHQVSGLVYRISWRPSEQFGFVRKSELHNSGVLSAEVEVMDGLTNLLPPDLGQRFVNEFSNLANAYKQSEMDTSDGVALYHLSSVPTDLAEPKEGLKASIVWKAGLEGADLMLSDSQTKQFHATGETQTQSSSRGKRGAYLASKKLVIEAGQSEKWYICADVEKDAAQVELIKAWIAGHPDRQGGIEKDCQEAEERLRLMLAKADGLQCTGDRPQSMRHTSNTLFNLMRGGTFPTGYDFPLEDFKKSIKHFNKEASKDLEKLLHTGITLACDDPWNPNHPLREQNTDLVRLAREYLPLSFSRRHGDPSRPWNRFSIEIADSDGSPLYYYQGNWRDIFQNWETLMHAYPEYCEASICRFLNATTVDGYNPYRLTKDGFDWEVIDPSDPWANIGYWGDHQIIYLLRLLETSVKFHPERLPSLMKEETFVYAEVPYRIRPYEQILKDPRETLDYDEDWEQRIATRVKEKGADGKLSHTATGSLVRVSLIEKLLSPLAAKLSNFIPGGGIWMNTQRPEWNDANNALVGYGISVVTLGYICRYLRFLINEFGDVLKDDNYQLSSELATFLHGQLDVFKNRDESPSGKDRLKFMDQLGHTATVYRSVYYDQGLSGSKTSMAGSTILDYLSSALFHAESCMRQNKRPDSLWHAYNLLKLDGEEASVERLNKMLEGQVAALTSGVLNTEEVLNLLKALRESDLYREDQNSYILYPNRDLPGFLMKNRVKAEDANRIGLLNRMLEAGDSRIVVNLPSGDVAFNGDFNNAKDVRAAIQSLEEAVTDDEVQSVLELFEDTFNHHAFTGRSGTFFAYEGLGSIYWHMVSKLALAVQENYIDMRDSCTDEQRQSLLDSFRHVQDGLGVNKNPSLYGAFPTDAYSHTPAHAGAQQPGMTGQVKEDILIRIAELGVSICEGRITFTPDMIQEQEYLSESVSFSIPKDSGESVTIDLGPDSLAFTFCGIPVVYRKNASEDGVTVHLSDGSQQAISGLGIESDLAGKIFRRTGQVARIDVAFA
jgi:hypothetical protein